MHTRELTQEDVPELYDIHRRFYEQEFAFPFGNDWRPLLDKYAIVDESDKIISFGSLELSAEAIVITDKGRAPQDKQEALIKLLEVLKYSARQHQFNAFHCLIQDSKWESILAKIGFKKCKGNYLYYPV